MPGRTQDDVGNIESYRIRIQNRAGGPIEVSADGGQTWTALGKVTRPATAAATSTPLITIVPTGTVAGVGPESILLRLPSVKTTHRSLRIVASGEPSAPSSIATDIPVQGGLFRSLAPTVGSDVRLERNGLTEPITATWAPRSGDRIVLSVPPPKPLSVTLENKDGGDVLVTEAGGAVRLIGKVRQALTGIGRYANTDRRGNGSVVTWSPSAIVVSSSGLSRKADPTGQAGEDRGGFVIQPAEPDLKGSTHPASQILVEALPAVEGSARLACSPLFGLTAVPSNGDVFDTAQMRTEIKVDDGNWERLPDMRGSVNADVFPAALQTALGPGRGVKGGITHIRFVFPAPTAASLDRRIRLASTPLADPPQRGRVNITADVMGGKVGYVRFFLNGDTAFLTNQAPFVWRWDTTQVPNGEHLIEIRGLDEDLNPLSTVTVKVLVDN